MVNYIAIIGLLLLIMLLALFFYISITLEKRKFKRFFEIEKEKIRLFNQLLALDYRIQKKSISDSKDNTFSYKYLSQVRYIILNYGYDLEKVELCPIKSHRFNKSTQITKEDFVKEFLKCPKNVKKDMVALSEIFDSIYAINHPIRYKFIKFKKNCSLHFLLLLLNICLFLLKIKEKCSENKKQKSILNSNKKIIEGKMSQPLIVNEYSEVVSAMA